MEKTTTASIKKIAILGAESTGKTDLSNKLAAHYHTVCVPEYAREYFDTHNINSYNISDLDAIAKKQLQLEQDYSTKANHLLICDTTLITIKIWSTYQFNKISELISNSIRSNDYDLYLVCNNDVKWEADSQRRNPELRDHLLKWNTHELTKLNVDYHIIEGTGGDKLKAAVKIIDRHFPAPDK
jgi:NadR type nicotinamide-nucleotide adenylyltransferase